MATRRTDEKVRVGADTARAERGFRRLSGMAKAAIAGVALAATAGAAKLASAMIGIFREQERAEIRLRRALVSSGQYTAQYEQRLQALSNQIQATTTTGDEAAQNMLAQLIAVGRVGPESIEAATRAALGYAELTQRSPVRVTRTWAAALADIADETSESLGELERLFSSLEIEQLRALKNTEGGLAAQARAIELLNERYGEHAAAVEGSTDVYSQLGNTWGDIKEEVGRLVHLLVGPLAEWIQSWLPSWVDGLRNVYVEVATLGEAFDVMIERVKAFFTGDTAAVEAAARRLEQARERIRAGMTGGGAPVTGATVPVTTGAATPTPEEEAAEEEIDALAEARAAIRVQAIRDEAEMLRATLAGMADAEVEYRRTQLELDRQQAEARLLIQEEATRAQGEAMLELIEQQRLIAEEQRIAAVEAARLASDEEYAEMVRRREEQLAYEREYGEVAGRIREFTHSRGIQGARAFMDGLANIQQTGNKKLDRLIRLASRARLLMDAATKPFEAYAKTSAAYPYPIGPALGALHAAAVAAQIAVGLRAVGGGSSGASPAGAAPTVAVGRGTAPPDPREQEERIIHVNVDLDGQSIAQVVQRQLAYVEEE